MGSWFHCILMHHSLERAVQLEPGNFKHLWRIGKLHLQRQEYAAAKSFFHRALQLDPHSIQVCESVATKILKLTLMILTITYH